ncbi:hypothetical protein IGI04_015070 [Brassica rapa subsp. trilocularis]|uniref:Ubiquitin-like protease family profile domain-containing protein n=1 Tax=Brassica rapa subsp. trilocularis TaxID=1813537 RepID=A0ABQ7MP02_BRACM|nr:hypothetical protein IGI04_015070 [Brassica rapa subsp. trilocularis]
MVSVRLVDSSDSPEEQPIRPIPEMMFAEGEEPVGVRVLTYLSSGAINRIFNALEEEEMLRKRTVEDRLVRIKYACLAILASVLLPTNLKMKICKEHAEAIADLEEFFAYPWGRLAFDMLMTSIKERDEIALSQNTIAVKGFSLALQLLVVEAVPSLTEVVQEMCSSSEGDSDEEADDMSVKPKRKTLSPAHARNVDKQSDVLVRSIIDSAGPEFYDEKVDNMVSLINTKFKFTKSMFVGGVTKLDVVRMSQSGNFTTKAKISKKQLARTPSNDPGYIASLVIEKIKPEFQTMDGNILEACKRVDSIEGSLVGLVHSVLEKFRDEMLESVRFLVSELTKGDGAAPPTLAQQGTKTPATENGKEPDSIATPLRDANDVTIRNILGNISAYSTPPDSPRLSQAENLSPTYNKEGLFGEAAGDNVNDSFALSAHSHNHRSCGQGTWSHGPFVDMPSFSLGLTQEGLLHCNHAITMPEIVTAVPEPIVVDVLMQLVQFNIHQHYPAKSHQRTVFLDSKYVSGISRTYPKFCKSRKKQSFIFPKGVVQAFLDRDEANFQATRYYFPLNVGKKHWVGICVDRNCGKITVLDCNTCLFTDEKIEKHLYPHLHMLPYIVRLSTRAVGSAEPKRFSVERPKNLSQIQNPCDDGLMSVLLMCSHAVYGIEACKNISTDSLVEEGKSAVVLAFEYKETM